MLKVLSVFGTRPEAIKMAPVVKELQKYPGCVLSKVCVTAQHREMLDQVLDLFGIVPDCIWWQGDFMTCYEDLCLGFRSISTLFWWIAREDFGKPFDLGYH